MPETESNSETEQATPDSPDLSAAAESLSAAFSPQAASPSKDEGSGPDDMPSDPKPEAGALPKGNAWNTGPQENPARETKEPVGTNNKPGEVPEGKEVFRDPETIKSWDKFRETYRSTKEELDALKKSLSETPKGGDQDFAKLRAKYEAVDRILNSEAYATEVMAPQAAALEKAKGIGRIAFIDDSAIEDLFRAETSYDAEKQLLDLRDPAAYSQLRPLVMDALEAREKGNAAVKSSDPVAELMKWQQRSKEVASIQHQRQLQEEIQIDSAVFKETFQTKIAETPVAKTDYGKQVFQRVLGKIESGEMIPRDDVLRGLYELEVSPAKDQLLTQQAQRIQQLEADLARIGGGSSLSTTITNPAQSGARTLPGALPPGRAWSTGR